MSEPPLPESPTERDSKDDDAMGAVLRRALAQKDVRQTDLLGGVQRKIRQRSRGKFFADGWSTSTGRFSYALVAWGMLVVIGIAYFVLAWISVR